MQPRQQRSTAVASSMNSDMSCLAKFLISGRVACLFMLPSDSPKAVSFFCELLLCPTRLSNPRIPSIPAKDRISCLDNATFGALPVVVESVSVSAFAWCPAEPGPEVRRRKQAITGHTEHHHVMVVTDAYHRPNKQRNQLKPNSALHDCRFE